MRESNITTEMNATQIADALRCLVAIQRPAFLWGKPGVGKSKVVKQVADGLGYSFKDVRAAQLDPVDLRGLPHLNGDGRAHWAIPDFLPNAKRDGEFGILFMDEMNMAPQLVQGACYQLILDRRLGDYELPKGWMVLAAGNRESDKGVTSRMPTPLANRFVHLYFGVDLDTWCKWAVGASVPVEVVAFLRFRPELLNVFDPSSAEKAYPTPRSWEFVGDILKGAPTKDVEYALIAGTVGQAAAAEFIGFLRVFRQLPSPDSVLMNPAKVHVPEDPATLYALTGALSRKASANNFDRIATYAKRIPAEFQVCLVRDSITKDNDIQQTRSFIEWAAANADVLS